MFRTFNLVFVVLFTGFSFLGSSAFAAESREIIKMKAIPGSEIYGYLAANCSDASWKTVSAWAKKTDFINRQMPAQEYTVNGHDVRTPDGAFQLFLKDNGEVTVDNDGRKFEGAVCDVVAQLVSAPKKFSFASFLPRANAEQLQTDFSKIDYTMATGLLASATGLGFMAGGPAGALVGAASGAAAIAYRYYSVIKRNRAILAGELAKLLNDKEASVQSCSKEKVTISDPPAIVTIQKSPKPMIIIAGAAKTGTLGPSTAEAQKAARDFQDCSSSQVWMMKKFEAENLFKKIIADRVNTRLDDTYFRKVRLEGAKSLN